MHKWLHSYEIMEVDYLSMPQLHWQYGSLTESKVLVCPQINNDIPQKTRAVFNSLSMPYYHIKLLQEVWSLIFGQSFNIKMQFYQYRNTHHTMKRESLDKHSSNWVLVFNNHKLCFSTCLVWVLSCINMGLQLGHCSAVPADVLEPSTC